MRDPFKKSVRFLFLVGVMWGPSVAPAYAQVDPIVKDPAAVILDGLIKGVHALMQYSSTLIAAATDLTAFELGNVGLSASGGLSKVENSIAMQTQAEMLMSKNIDQEIRSASYQNVASEIAAQYTVSPVSIICATTMGDNMQEQSKASAAALLDELKSYEASKDTGPKADAFGPGAAAEDLKDLCDLGFLGNSPDKGRYGNLTATLKCKPPKTDQYLNADLKLSSVLDKHQYLLPAQQPTPTKDGHLLFANTVDATETPPGIGTELDWIAAYKYCEHLTTLLPTPTHPTGAATISDFDNMHTDRNDVSSRGGASDMCFKALVYRTAVSSNASNQLGASVGIAGGDPHAVQVAACDFLRMDAPKGGGLSFQQVDQSGGAIQGGDPVFANVLQGCHTYGLSPMMYDEMMAKKCHDMAYMIASEERLADPAEVEEVRTFECNEAEDAFRLKLDREHLEIQKAINNLLKLRGMGASPNNLARVKQ